MKGGMLHDFKGDEIMEIWTDHKINVFFDE